MMAVTCYHTKDNGAFYQFSFERQPSGEWRAYIHTEPNYRGRDATAPATHRNVDGGRRYVCWTAPLRSEQAARSVAKAWAEATQEYIRTGRRF
jgi:hypothetical protein